MKKGITLSVLCLFLFVGVRGDSQYKYINSWDSDIYFGHVIYPEAKHDGKDAVVLREGKSTPEVADLNLPIAPGDKIMTSERRCEIQFDTGTIIRLDRNTELKIQTILARSLSSKNKLTNLLLNRGQAFVMYKRYVRREIFQIITPNTAVKLNHNSVSLIKAMADGSTDIFMSEGKGYALYGLSENAIKRIAIKKSEKIMITPNHKVVAGQYEKIEDFEAWNEKLNREFLEFHEGKAVIPLPIQKLSRGVYYFAQKFSNQYGEWLWDSLYGYVWRPFLNDHSYPWGGWMPFYQGHWSSVQGQLFWVPSEPWGWVPYHLGIWMWNKKKGWLWIPGSVFAPAWVDWAFFSGRFCWRAWSITDWYGYAVYRDGYFPYFAHLIHPEDDEFLQYVSRGQGIETVRKILTKDQLKSKKAAPFPMPDELKDAYKRVVVALKNGDEEILSLLKETPNHMLVVSSEDLNSPRIHEKIVNLTSLSGDKNIDFPTQIHQKDPHRQAKQTFNRNEKVSSLREKVTDLISDLKGMKSLETQEFQLSRLVVDPKPQTKQDRSAAKRILQPDSIKVETTLQKGKGSASRFLDWNPDVKAARSSGVSIRYSSRSNEVRCPELNISSRQVMGSRGYNGPRVHLTSRGSVAASGTSGASYGGGGSSGSASQGNSSNSTSTNTGSKNSGSSGKGGVVKK